MFAGRRDMLPKIVPHGRIECSRRRGIALIMERQHQAMNRPDTFVAAVHCELQSR